MNIVSLLNIQIPKDVPHPVNNSPIDLSEPADLILYVVLPVLAIIFYLLYRRRRKNDKME